MQTFDLLDLATSAALTKQALFFGMTI